MRPLFSIVSILFLVTGCGTLSTSGATGDGELTIIHINDTYRIDALRDGRLGGFGRVATLVEEVQNEGRTVILTHGGDFLFPSLESSIWSGAQMIAALNFLNTLAPLYVVPGNHEFDSRDVNVLANAVRESDFVWVGDNIRFKTGLDDVDGRITAGLVIEHRQGSIGVFGITAAPGRGGRMRDFAPVGDDYLHAAKNAIVEHESRGVDMVMGLTHVNLPEDLELSTLREDHPSFLWIAGGHEHEREFQPLTEERAMVTKGASNAREVWRIDVNFDGENTTLDARSIVLDEQVRPHPEYLKFEDEWRTKLLEIFPFLESTLGYAAVPLDGRESTVRSQESNWGNFIADEMRDAFGEPSDFAIINGGTLRIDDLIEGDITFEDIARTFGYSNELRHITMTGSEFRTVLERSYRGARSGKGYFLQVSGVRVCFDRSKPEDRRIVELLALDQGQWAPIDPEKEYRIVVPDYLFQGGDGFDFSQARSVSLPASEVRYLVFDAIVEAQARGDRIGTTVDAKTPRIARADPETGRCFDQ